MFGLFKRKKKETSPAKQGKYIDLTVSDVRKETKDAVRVEFDWPENGMDYKPGQFLTLILPVNGEKIRRAYSLCTSPSLDEKPAVAVKRVDDGIVSNFINDNVKAGDVIEVMPPLGHFTPEISPDNSRHLILIGGGSGITPLMGILKTVLKEEPNSNVTLIYANRDIDSIIFKEKLEEIKLENQDRFNYIQSLDNAPAEWSGEGGFLNVDKVKSLITNLDKWNDDSTYYYVCGPQGLMDLAFEAFDALQLDHHRTFKESFVAGTTSPDEIIAGKTKGSGDGSQVKIKYDGQEYEFTVPAGNTILQTALDQDIDLPFSCQSGLCTACMGKCLEGEVDLSDAEALSEEERAEGYVLTCVGKPLTDKVEIEI
ncbi:MAG: ferredoxin--NADP reductase [Cyclobacteriaceae bacterium]